MVSCYYKFARLFNENYQQTCAYIAVADSNWVQYDIVSPGDKLPPEIPANYRGYVEVPGSAFGLYHPVRRPNDIFELGQRRYRAVDIYLWSCSYLCVLDLPGSRLAVFGYQALKCLNFAFWRAIWLLGWYGGDPMTRPTLRDIRPFGIGRRNG